MAMVSFFNTPIATCTRETLIQTSFGSVPCQGNPPPAVAAVQQSSGSTMDHPRILISYSPQPYLRLWDYKSPINGHSIHSNDRVTCH